MSNLVSTTQTNLTGGKTPMSILRQESLLSIDVLYDLEPTQRYDELFSTLTIDPTGPSDERVFNYSL